MKKKILLVDDSKTQLNALKMFFEKAGFEVITAVDAVIAYPMIFQHAPDIIVSDILMPNLNGYQFCRLIKNNYLIKKIPVILLTILDQRIDRFWGKEAGAQLFMSKTSDFKDIVQAVNNLCNSNPILEQDRKNILAQRITNESIQYQLNSILDDSLQQSVIMNEFRFLTEFLDDEKLLVENLFSLLDSLLDYNCCAMFFAGVEQDSPVSIYYDIQKQHLSDDLLTEISKQLVCNVQQKEVCDDDNFFNIVFTKRADNSTINSFNEFKTIFTLPITFEDRLLGVVALYSTQEADYQFEKFLDTMKNELLLLMRIKRLYAQTKHLAVTDTLTGLYNRRHLAEYLHREFTRTKRYKGSFSIAILDLDKFKSVNDTYGHQVGDYVLKEAADLLIDAFRKTDMIFRYGGEEFIILLPETSAPQAFIPLERFRKKLETHNFSFDDLSFRMTVSGGICDNANNLEDENVLIKNADIALYKAKKHGRNRILIYNE